MFLLATAHVSLCMILVLSGFDAQFTEQDAKNWLDDYNEKIQVSYYNASEANWLYSSNLTTYNAQIALEESTRAAAFDKASALQAREYDWENFNDTSLRRQFSKIIDIGPAILPEEQYRRLTNLTNEMEFIYSTATVCNKPGDSSGNCYPLEPDLTALLANSSTDWDTLLWAWEGWRNESGRKMPDMYKEATDLLNVAAKMNNYTDNGDYWRSWFESDTFREDCESLWLELKPLYIQLHAYVRRKLVEKFPTGYFPSEGHIPAHILGDMWSQSWEPLDSLVRPYPAVPGVDVTNEMVRQNYTVQTIFEVTEEFFTSLGLLPMPERFWNKSIMVKPTDRDIVCHASAWDFSNGKDFRIKQCTEVTQPWLITTHHEMGHIEYFLQYKDQPVKFRDGANPGFHEALGDTLALSATTPEHLIKIGLLPDFVDDPRGDLNFLMQQALQKIAFIPFGYLVDQWRWELFEGRFNRTEYNSRWWEMKCRYQGVSPPVNRTAQDFDPGSKYHIPTHVPYISYFVANILQFQFHQSLCNASGNYTGPLHRCDIYQSLEAGKLLENMMKVGSSIPWPDVLNQIAGTRKMSVQPILEYFEPLRVWLVEQNYGHPTGWIEDCPAEFGIE